MSDSEAPAGTEETITLDTVFHTVMRIGQRRRKDMVARPSWYRNGDAWWYLILVITVPLLSVGFAIAAWQLESPGLRTTALALLTASYISGPVIYPLVILFRYRENVRRFIRFPASILIDQAQRDATADRKDIRDLASRDDWALDQVLTYLRLERSHLEKRTGLLVGALDKVGAVPSLATLVATLHSVGSFDAVATGPTWLEGALYGVFGLYAVGWAAHVSMMRMDRMIGALELAIEAGQADRPSSAA